MSSVRLSQLETWMDCEDPDLRVQVERRVRDAWPTLSLDLGAFMARLASLRTNRLDRQVDLARLAIEDLFLAFACSQRDPDALRIFACDYEPELRLVASRYRMSDSDLGDVRQAIWNKLFVTASESAGKILDYQGEGRLRYWFRAVASRAVVDHLRQLKSSEQGHSHDVDALRAAASDADPELAVIRKRYSVEFREAFEFAVRSLEPDERNAIRVHFLLGMTIDQMAVAFGVHRATAARRLVRARERLYSLTRERLKSSLGARSGELESVMRLYSDHLSITLSRILE